MALNEASDVDFEIERRMSPPSYFLPELKEDGSSSNMFDAMFNPDAPVTVEAVAAARKFAQQKMNEFYERQRKDSQGLSFDDVSGGIDADTATEIYEELYCKRVELDIFFYGIVPFVTSPEWMETLVEATYTVSADDRWVLSPARMAHLSQEIIPSILKALEKVPQKKIDECHSIAHQLLLYEFEERDTWPADYWSGETA